MFVVSLAEQLQLAGVADEEAVAPGVAFQPGTVELSDVARVAQSDACSGKGQLHGRGEAAGRCVTGVGEVEDAGGVSEGENLVVGLPILRRELNSQHGRVECESGEGVTFLQFEMIFRQDGGKEGRAESPLRRVVCSASVIGETGRQFHQTAHPEAPVVGRAEIVEPTA